MKGWKPRRLGGGLGGKKESGQLRFGGRDRPFKPPLEKREALRYSTTMAWVDRRRASRVRRS
ncbi:hypothetical protein GQ600_13274 [Phytophthora cactorum]|nr:hypothetical protein GQ600_13274 [Phytophthora cactorum]